MRLGWLVIKYLPTYRYLRLVTCNRHHYNTLPERLAGPPSCRIRLCASLERAIECPFDIKERYTQQQNNECTTAFVWSWLSPQSAAHMYSTLARLCTYYTAMVIHKRIGRSSKIQTKIFSTYSDQPLFFRLITDCPSLSVFSSLPPP